MSDPKGFLRRYPIMIGGQPAGPATFEVTEVFRPNARRTTGILHKSVAATEGVSFRPVINDGLQLRAWSVAMQAWDGANFNWLNIPAPSANLPKFILTGQLTGCSFMVEDTGGGTIRCAHQQHGAAHNAAGLRGIVAGMPNVVAYTNGDQYNLGTHQVLVIGVAVDGVWKIYAQRLARAPGNAHSILGVDRIF